MKTYGEKRRPDGSFLIHRIFSKNYCRIFLPVQVLFKSQMLHRFSGIGQFKKGIYPNLQMLFGELVCDFSVRF